MINKIVGEYAKSFEKPTEEYLRGVFNKLCDMYDYSCIPERFLVTEIDDAKLPKKFKIVNDEIIDIIENRKSVGVRLPDFRFGGYVTSKLLYTYILNQLKTDEHISSFLYIDTNIFMRDLKRFMNKDEFDDFSRWIENMSNDWMKEYKEKRLVGENLKELSLIHCSEDIKILKLFYCARLTYF